MNKQTFPIPEGCKAITMEIIDNTIVTTFEPVEPKFKRGDVLISKTGNIAIFDRMSDRRNWFHEIVGLAFNDITNLDACVFGNTNSFRIATPEEAQRLWDALAKEGKRWNPETMQVEEIKNERWRAEKYEVYYCPIGFEGANSPIKDNRSIIDDYMFDNCFYCQTPDQSERLFKAIKQVTDKFWEDELK